MGDRNLSNSDLSSSGSFFSDSVVSSHSSELSPFPFSYSSISPSNTGLSANDIQTARCELETKPVNTSLDSNCSDIRYAQSTFQEDGMSSSSSSSLTSCDSTTSYTPNTVLVHVGCNVFTVISVKTPDDYPLCSNSSVPLLPSFQRLGPFADVSTKAYHKKPIKKLPRQRKNFDTGVKTRILEQYSRLIHSPKHYSIRMIAQSIYEEMRKEE